MSILSSIRDRAVESFIRKNETVQRFGEVDEVSIDAESRIATVKITLRGESQTTLFKGHYGFDEGEKGTELVFKKITCERAWIDEAIKYALGDKALRFPIADYSGEKLAGITGGIAKILF